MATTVQQLVSALIDKIYPVGVIIGFTQDIDPNKQIGGGWRQIKDCFLYASGSKALGSTGGEETHVLTVAEMPSHNHGVHMFLNSAPEMGWGADNVEKPMADQYDQIRYTGGNQPHNNMPPYRTVNFWERIS